MKLWLDKIWHSNIMQMYALIKSDIYKEPAITWKMSVMLRGKSRCKVIFMK